MLHQLAQSIPVVDQALGIILSQGIMGSLVFFLGIALYREHAAHIKALQDRVNDAKEFGEIVAKNSEVTAVHTSTVQGVVGMGQNILQMLQNVRMVK